MKKSQNYRYPGARSFEEDEKHLFFGREKEIEELCQQIKVENHLVLFAKSGIGKTSLINAGIIPQLRNASYFPITVRFQNTSISPINTLCEELKKFVPENLIQKIPQEQSQLIWYYLKYGQFKAKEEFNSSPLFIFDQFEELFHHSQADIDNFSYQLADLINERLPDAIQEEFEDLPRNVLKNDRSLVEWYQPAKLKVLIAIRNSRLSQLDELSHNIPSILNNRFSLSPLQAEQAKSAIIIPASFKEENLFTQAFEYQEETVNLIVKNLQNEKGEIEPFQLQILCQHIEESVQKQQEAGISNLKISPKYLGGKNGIQDILNNYYENQIAQITPYEKQRAARKLIEEGLIIENRRISLSESVVRSQFGLDQNFIEQLLLTRIIRGETTNLGRTYEISHDTLIAPILKSFEQRRARETRRKLLINIFLGIAIISILVLSFLLIRRAILADRQEVVEQATTQLSSENQEFRDSILSIQEQFLALDKRRQSALIRNDVYELRIIQLQEDSLRKSIQLDNAIDEDQLRAESQMIIDSLNDLIEQRDSFVSNLLAQRQLLDDRVLLLEKEIRQNPTLNPVADLDEAVLYSENDTYELFNSLQYYLDGSLITSSKGQKGKGIVRWRGGSLQSNLFSFGSNTIEADTATLTIRLKQSNDVILGVSNLKSYLDVQKGFGRFESIDPSQVVFFDYNEYKTTLDAFEWNLSQNTITFLSSNYKPGLFISTSTDNVSFKSNRADFNFLTNQLQIEGVPHIVSANAFIYPDSGKVEVLPRGLITTLENARIIADTITKYHVINRATVNILNKRSYNGSGFYEYKVNNKKQEIKFNKIIGQPFGNQRINNNPAYTKAEGFVTELNDFLIDSKTQYKGRILLSSDSKNLFFDGYAKLNTDKLPKPYWFSIKSEGDKNNLIIKYKKPKSTTGENLFTGFYLDRLSANIYPRVMMPLIGRRDQNLLSVTGYFKYDKENDTFIFGDSTRIFTDNLKGNKLIFNNKTGKINAEGLINIGTSFKVIDVIAGGNVEMYFQKGEPHPDIKMKLMAAISMAIPERLLKIMALDIVSSAFATPNIPYLTDLPFFKMAASQVLPENKENKETINFISSGYLEIPKKNNTYSFLFGDLEMTWNSEYQSFLNTSDTVGLVSISGRTINKMLIGYIQFNLRNNGDDRLYIFIESPSGYFFYFALKQGIIEITSDNGAFNNELSTMRKRDFYTKLPNGKILEIISVEPIVAKLFIKRMRYAQKN